MVGTLLHTPDYFGKCMIGGSLACGLTHAAVVAIDVSKCRAQAHSITGRWPSGMIASMRRTFAEEGYAGLRIGWVPTLIGYGAQGLAKFGFNEMFLDLYGGRETTSTAQKMLIWALASGSAEIFADVALCPFEMTKVKMQVTLPGMEGGVPKKLGPALSQMNAMKADTGFPFGSLKPLWLRQIPYTMIKFVGFYQTQETVYRYLHKNWGRPKESFPAYQQLSITFGCGYFAGVFCAIATQPFDNLVSMKGNAKYKNSSFGEMAKEMGTTQLFTKGLGARIIMIGTLTGLQWWIYGTWKNLMGFGTS